VRNREISQGKKSKHPILMPISDFNNFSAQFAMFTMSAVRTILQLQTTSGNTC
jgi:hypothetical protein